MAVNRFPHIHQQSYITKIHTYIQKASLVGDTNNVHLGVKPLPPSLAHKKKLVRTSTFCRGVNHTVVFEVNGFFLLCVRAITWTNSFAVQGCTWPWLLHLKWSGWMDYMKRLCCRWELLPVQNMEKFRPFFQHWLDSVVTMKPQSHNCPYLIIITPSINIPKYSM